jgi:molybdopterin adenylyltransferase
MKVARLTLSDPAGDGGEEDLNGPAIETGLGSLPGVHWRWIRMVLPDDPRRVTFMLRRLCDEESCDLVLLAGCGAVTRLAITRMLTPAGVDADVLCRCVIGRRGGTLLVNVCGTPEEIVESLRVLELWIGQELGG